MAKETRSRSTKNQASDSNKSADKPNGQPRYKVEPEFWDTLLDALPPWIDEIVGVALLVFGLVSFSALLGLSSDARLAMAWSDAMTSLFGFGSLLVSAGIFMMGIIIFLPKLGIDLNLSRMRILALQAAFLAILVLLHLGSGDAELRALARSGEGGGMIGWGLSVPFLWLFGQTVTIILFGIILFLSLGIVAGIKREQVTSLLARLAEILTTTGSNLATADEEDADTKSEDQAPVYSIPGRSRLDDASWRNSPASSVVLIRPDLANVPPSQRPGAVSEPALVSRREPETMTEDDAQRLTKALDHASETPPTLDPDAEFNIIGTLLERKNKKESQMVQRPDGRIKQYFNVEEMKEAKKVARRSADLPDLSLLQDVEMEPPDDLEINQNVVLIENTLLEFDIDIDVVDVKVGPVVTQYAVQPFREKRDEEGEVTRERTRLSKIAALSSDLSLALSAKRLRLETPVPGQSYMGIEVPNKNPSTVALRSVFESRYFYDQLQKARSPLVVPLGRDVAGEPVAVDLAAMPHLLIAGTTGSGKSVCIAAIASSLVLNNTPDTVKLVMLDPKMVELPRFNGLPHLLGPVETDLERVIGVLRWCTREMDRRYKLLEENAARNIEIFNSRLGQRRKKEHLPYMVILVDEIGDLMMNRPEETEAAVTRLAQMARAVGMHLVVATQRPSVDVITGLIKANFPARISFAVASGTDSRVILDSVGAETLLGKGDMLYQAPDAGAPRRLQGCYVTDNEVRAIVQHWKDWSKTNLPESERYRIPPWERGLTRREFLAETDPMLEDAIELVVREQEASASMIQRKLGLGYPRAARLVDLMEELGIIGDPVDGGRSRKVLIEKGKDPFKEIIERRARNQ